MGNTASDEQMATNLLPVSDINISDLFAKINPIDKNFLKYIPSQFLNENREFLKQIYDLRTRRLIFGRAAQSSSLVTQTK